MADPQPGDQKDRLIVEIEGSRAKELFDAMPGPAKPSGCTDLPEKRSGGLVCFSDGDGTYRCSVGVKLDTGETTNATIC